MRSAVGRFGRSPGSRDRLVQEPLRALRRRPLGASATATAAAGGLSSENWLRAGCLNACEDAATAFTCFEKRGERHDDVVRPGDMGSSSAGAQAGDDLRTFAQRLGQRLNSLAEQHLAFSILVKPSRDRRCVQTPLSPDCGSDADAPTCERRHPPRPGSALAPPGRWPLRSGRSRCVCGCFRRARCSRASAGRLATPTGRRTRTQGSPADDEPWCPFSSTSVKTMSPLQLPW